MATIQIREIPDDSYEVIRRRANESGQSIQAYMRRLVIEVTARPTTEEAIASITAAHRASDAPGATRTSILADLAAERR